MKIFGLIVAILIWLLTAFGCEPAKPMDTPAETPVVTVAPTKRPPKPTAKPTAEPTPTPQPANPDREDTLLPEL